MVRVQSYRLSLALVPPLPLCAGVVAVWRFPECTSQPLPSCWWCSLARSLHKRWRSMYTRRQSGYRGAPQPSWEPRRMWSLETASPRKEDLSSDLKEGRISKGRERMGTSDLYPKPMAQQLGSGRLYEGQQWDGEVEGWGVNLSVHPSLGLTGYFLEVGVPRVMLCMQQHFRKVNLPLWHPRRGELGLEVGATMLAGKGWKQPPLIHLVVLLAQDHI